MSTDFLDTMKFRFIGREQIFGEIFCFRLQEKSMLRVVVMFLNVWSERLDTMKFRFIDREQIFGEIFCFRLQEKKSMLRVVVMF